MARGKISQPSGKRPGKDALPLAAELFSQGDRVCMAVSGGADSTALMRLLFERREHLGIVLSVVHVEHGLRGDAANRDAAFVLELAHAFDLPCDIVAVDTPQRVAEHKESVEEAARNLRYGVFRELLAAGKADKVATAHTLDDQAETVLMKLLRGAWTEGLSGIHPMVWLDAVHGRQSVIRPLLGTRRWQIEEYLRALGQPWCQDETNESETYTRNRVRHELLPAMRDYNPQIEEILAHVAANARAEEQHWQAELTRVLPQLLLEGKPVRGGGRRASTAPGAVQLALEIPRLRVLHLAMQRRVLRATAERCGATLDFAATERLLNMLSEGRNSGPTPKAARRLNLPGNVRVERTARELQFEREESHRMGAMRPDLQEESCADGSNRLPVYQLLVPGSVDAPAFEAEYTATLVGDTGRPDIGAGPQTSATPAPAAQIRAWRPGDRVWLRYSSKPKKVKEVLLRMGIGGEEKSRWPVIEWRGTIVWMRGVELAESEISSLNGSPEARLRIVEERGDARSGISC